LPPWQSLTEIVGVATGGNIVAWMGLGRVRGVWWVWRDLVGFGGIWWDLVGFGGIWWDF